MIVDAASEYDLRGFLAKGADLVAYSAHKFLGGPTAGIVAGRKDLVRATFLQNYGIGRGMKVGKESIAGAIAALDAWGKRDHAAVRAREGGYLDALDGAAGEACRASRRQHRSGPHRQSARSAQAGDRSRRSPAPRPGRSPLRSRVPSRRSSCAITRSSTAISISTPATSIPERRRSWPIRSPPLATAIRGQPSPHLGDLGDTSTRPC